MRRNGAGGPRTRVRGLGGVSLDVRETAGREAAPRGADEQLLQALQALAVGTFGRVYDIQMIFSDPTTEPLMQLDRKSAFGAFDSRGGEVRR